MRSSRRHRLVQGDATPSRRAQNRAPEAPASTVQRLNGVFAKGTWYCNCDPRDEATLRKVERSKENRGRLYWSCDRTHTDPRRCDFFLWESEARVRSGDKSPPSDGAESAPAVQPTTPPRTAARNQHSTARPDATQMPTPSTRTSTAKASKSRSIREFFKSNTEQAGTSSEEEAQGNAPDPGVRLPPSSSATMVPETPTAGPKRKRVEFEEDLIGDLSSDEERQMNEAMERSTRKLQQGAPIVTPAAERTGAASGGPTPATARTLFPDAKRARAEGSGAAAAEGAGSPVSGPSPQQGDDGGFVDEIMNLLRGQPLEDSVRRSVAQALDRQSGKMRGYMKGRDNVRAQLKTKEDRIAQLQERITALENKSKMQRQELTEIKAGLANLYSRH